MAASIQCPTRWMTLLAIVTSVGFALGCFGNDTPTRELAKDGDVQAGETSTNLVLSKQPNIIFITIDTLRADHLSAYGYHRRTSPWLDSLAGQGVLFERSYAGSSWTVPSMATLFTGLYPFQHGVETGLFKRGAIVEQPQLPQHHETLAEQLKAAGYTTFGISTNGHLTEALGFGQGFDRYVNEGYLPARFIYGVVSEWAEDIRAASPYFLWLHFFDPHMPYRLRQPWAERFDEVDEGETPAEQVKRLEYWASKDTEFVVRSPESKHPNAAKTLVTLYDSEIRYTDNWARWSTEILEPEPDTVILYTSDHGEEFLDHGKYDHGISLYDELVAVPLVVMAPGRIPPNTRISEPMSAVDILPSLIHLATGEAPPKNENGAESLWPVMTGETVMEPRPVLMSSHRAHGVHVGMVHDGMKLIRQEATQIVQLHDMVADRYEKFDLSLKRPKRAADMQDRMDAMRTQFPRYSAPISKEKLSDEAIENLQALGYIDGESE